MKAIRLLLPIATLALAAAMGPAAAANANPYPPTGPLITVTDGTIMVGESVEVTGSGFAPGESITYEVRCGSLVVEDHVVADQTGAFRHELTMNQACTATIAYTGTESGLSGSVTVLVVTSRAELPTTGTDGGTYLRIGLTGLGIALVGTVLVGLAVRRRRVGQPLGD